MAVRLSWKNKRGCLKIELRQPLFFVYARVKCDLYYCSSPNYGLLLPIT